LAEELRAEVVRARAEVEEESSLLRGEAGSLAARIDEVLGLRQADVEAARAVSDQLGERLEEVAARTSELSESFQAVALEPGLEEELGRIAAAVDVLADRLDEQAAIADESARATEEVLRRSLADPNERMVGSEEKPSGKKKKPSGTTTKPSGKKKKPSGTTTKPSSGKKKKSSDSEAKKGKKGKKG
jgi:DNA-binding transcriptional MerR regulator